MSVIHKSDVLRASNNDKAERVDRVPKTSRGVSQASGSASGLSAPRAGVQLKAADTVQMLSWVPGAVEKAMGSGGGGGLGGWFDGNLPGVEAAPQGPLYLPHWTEMTPEGGIPSSSGGSPVTDWLAEGKTEWDSWGPSPWTTYGI